MLRTTTPKGAARTAITRWTRLGNIIDESKLPFLRQSKLDDKTCHKPFLREAYQFLSTLAYGGVVAAFLGGANLAFPFRWNQTKG